MSRGGNGPYKGGPGSSGPRAGRPPVEVRYELKGDPSRERRDRPAPPVADYARPVTDIRIDGGTAFGLLTDASAWRPEFRALVDRLLRMQHDRARSEVALDPDELPNVTTPLPRLPEGRKPQRGLAGVLMSDEGDAVDFIARGFSERFGLPVCDINIGGRSITFFYHDRAFVRLMRRVDTDGRVRWYLRVEAKAPELYQRGFYEWARTWLGYFSWLTGAGWAEICDFRRIGWATAQAHANADYVGIHFVYEDALDVTAARKRTVFGRQLMDDDDDAGDGEAERDFDELLEEIELDDDDELDGDEDDDEVLAGDHDRRHPLSHRPLRQRFEEPPPGFMQTFQVGRKSSDVLLVGYRKGDEQREVARIDPAASRYAALWRAHGWDPDLDGDPFRIEVRLRKKGLIYRHIDRDEIAYDFRDPALLADEHALRVLWAAITTRRRVVDRTATRQRRCPTDPRWRIVQSVCKRPPIAEIRQVAHEVAALTRGERLVKGQKRVFDAVQDLALYEAGVGLEHRSDFAASLRRLADRVERGAIELEGLGRGVLPHPWRASKALRRKPALVQFFADELGEHVQVYQAELRAYGGLGGIPIDELLPLIAKEQEEDDGKHQSSGAVGEPRSGPGSSSDEQRRRGVHAESGDVEEVHEEEW